MGIRVLPALLSVVFAVSGCSLFGLDDSEFEVNLPMVPIGPVNIAVSGATALLCEQFDVTNLCSGLGDEGACTAVEYCTWTGAGNGCQTGSITLPLAQGFATDLRQDQQEVNLDQYEGQIKGVTVRSITYDISHNTLTKDLEAIDIFFGPKDAIEDLAEVDIANARERGAVRFGRTDDIEAGTTTQGVPKEVRRDVDAETLVREHLSSFAFASLFATEITLSPEDCLTLSGDLEVLLGIEITFFVDPL